MKHTLIALFGAIAAILILAGCSEPPPEKATIAIGGPPGMTVSINDDTTAKAPVTLKLQHGTYLFKFQAPGYVRKWETVVLKPGEKRKMQLQLEHETASVMIVTKPVGAQLIVEGKTLGATPLVIEKVVPGREYSGQLRMPGYSEREVRWSVEGARPKRVLIDLDANIVKAEFKSKPAGAQLSINGRVVGVTPYKGELTEGRYNLRLEHIGYSPLEQTVSLSRGEDFQTEYNLAPLAGGISITSVPEGAAIYIDGRKCGVTPCVVADLPAGIHEVRALKDGFDPVSRKVEVSPGFKDEIRLVLLSSTGELELDVRPAGVAVMLDGKELGITEVAGEAAATTKPIRVSGLAPGVHVVTVSHPRARPETREIEVEIEKGKLTRPRAIDVWVANCEIKYIDGRVEVGALFEENDDIIFFGSEPGIKYEIKRSDLAYVKRLEIEQKPAAEEEKTEE